MSPKYSEKLFRQNFVKWFRTYFPLGHIQSIESEATSAGVPDINICKGGRETWVELKSGRLTTSSIKPGQYMWHTKRAQAGGTTWVVQRDDNGNICIFKGCRIKEFQDKPNSVVPDKIFSSASRESRIDMFNYLLS